MNKSDFYIIYHIEMKKEKSELEWWIVAILVLIILRWLGIAFLNS